MLDFASLDVYCVCPSHVSVLFMDKPIILLTAQCDPSSSLVQLRIFSKVNNDIFCQSSYISLY